MLSGRAELEHETPVVTLTVRHLSLAVHAFPFVVLNNDTYFQHHGHKSQLSIKRYH